MSHNTRIHLATVLKNTKAVWPVPGSHWRLASNQSANEFSQCGRVDVAERVFRHFLSSIDQQLRQWNEEEEIPEGRL
jgi:hypothetical protein